MKLINPSDDELNAAFAEWVAGWRKVSPFIRIRTHDRINILKGVNPSGKHARLPQFTHSMDAVLPWLEKCASWEKEANGQVWVGKESDHNQVGAGEIIDGEDIPIPRACVVALLRAHGVEVEFTK